MQCVITAGPTYEPLDDVRRLTNFSTGRLGTELAAFLTLRGHHVTLLAGDQSTWCGERMAAKVQIFTTTEDLRQRLQALSVEPVKAVFHAAAVSDFSFGKIWRRAQDGALEETRSGKLSTRDGPFLAELVPTRKILADLREWFPGAVLVGWKYEVDSDRAGALDRAAAQIRDCALNACVANGPAYGSGFGVVLPDGNHTHQADCPALFESLESLLNRASATGA